MEHYPGHLLVGVVALLVTALLGRFTVNTLVQRKLRLSALLFGAYVLVHLGVAVWPGALAEGDAELRSFERLGLAAGLINLVVITLANPLRVNRVPDRFPSILQDAVVFGVLVIVGSFVFDENLLTTSAVGAVVVGFAMQDTLGNAFAGLAIQSEKPFGVGHWIRVGEFEGRVAEVTWRATKLRTKAGNFVVVPNNLIADETIMNYSEPAGPTRLELEVGATYLAAPNAVKAAVAEAIAQVPRVLQSPAPDVLLSAFDDSAITYRPRFWVADYEVADEVRDQVRTAIYYAFKRRNIEIPWPIEVEYQPDWPEADPLSSVDAREEAVARIELLSGLRAEQRREIAEAAGVRTFGDGEAIVRQNEPGDSMFLVCSGSVAVRLEVENRDVATIGEGGCFGEMSLLTGEPRSATVVARGDVKVLEVGSAVVRRIAAADPVAVEALGLAVISRRAELTEITKQVAETAVVAVPATFLSKMRRFLGLS